MTDSLEKDEHGMSVHKDGIASLSSDAFVVRDII